MAQFILLLRGFNQNLKDYSPEELQRLFEKYDSWVAGINQAGKLRGAQKLKDEVRRSVTVQNDKILDGPFTETKETIGGYFVVECQELEGALEIAKKCPILLHGGSVELRELLTEDCRYSSLVGTS